MVTVIDETEVRALSNDELIAKFGLEFAWSDHCASYEQAEESSRFLGVLYAELMRRMESK